MTFTDTFRYRLGHSGKNISQEKLKQQLVIRSQCVMSFGDFAVCNIYDANDLLRYLFRGNFVEGTF